MALQFSQPTPLLKPEKLSPFTEEYTKLLSRFGCDENYSNNVKLILNIQTSNGKKFLQKINEELAKGEQPAYVVPSLHFAKANFYTDRLNHCFEGTVVTSGKYVYYCTGAHLNQVSRLDRSKIMDPDFDRDDQSQITSPDHDIIIPSSMLEGPIEQICVSKNFILTKSAMEIAVYEIKSFEAVLKFQHKRCIGVVALAPTELKVAFTAEEKMYLLEDDQLSTVVSWQGRDLLFVDDNHLRYSCGTEIFELNLICDKLVSDPNIVGDELNSAESMICDKLVSDPNIVGDILNSAESKNFTPKVVFSHREINRDSDVYLVRKSKNISDILYYFLANEIYVVKQSSRGDYLGKFRHDNNFAPNFADVVSAGNAECIVFSASIGRVEIVMCDVSSNTCRFRDLTSIDTVAQTLERFPLSHNIFPTCNAIQRLTSPTVGIAALSGNAATEIYIQNAWGDLFYVTSDNFEAVGIQQSYGKWLESFKNSDENPVTMTGVIPVPEDVCSYLFDDLDDSSEWTN